MPLTTPDASGLTRSDSRDLWLHHGVGRSPTKPQRAVLGPLVFEVGEVLKRNPAPALGPVMWAVPSTDSANYPIPTGPSARRHTFPVSYQSRTLPPARADDWRFQEALRPRAGAPIIPVNASERQQTGTTARPHAVRALPRSKSWSEIRASNSASSLLSGSSSPRSSSRRPMTVHGLRPSTTCSALIAKQLDAPRIWAMAKASPRADEVVREARCATPADEATLRDQLIEKKVRMVPRLLRFLTCAPFDIASELDLVRRLLSCVQPVPELWCGHCAQSAAALVGAPSCHAERHLHLRPACWCSHGSWLGNERKHGAHANLNKQR